MTFSSNLRTWRGFQLGFGDHALLGGCGKREQRHESFEQHRRQSIYAIARRGCVVGMLTSNGIPAAASSLVGIAPSKT
jgi:hypothetical protein